MSGPERRLRTGRLSRPEPTRSSSKGAAELAERRTLPGCSSPAERKSSREFAPPVGHTGLAASPPAGTVGTGVKKAVLGRSQAIGLFAVL